MSHAQVIYTWRDSKGVLNFSDQLPTVAPTTGARIFQAPSTKPTLFDGAVQQITYGPIAATPGGGTTTPTTSTSNVPSPVSGAKNWHPGHYVFAQSVFETIGSIGSKLDGSPMFRGVEMVYSWNEIETSRGVYNFSTIDSHLSYLAARGKYLIIALHVQPWNSGANYCPAYLKGSEFGGGVYKDSAQGAYPPVLWNNAVRDRYNLLIQALATRYKSHPNFEGIEVMIETSPQPFNPSDPANAGVDPFDAIAFRDNVESLVLTANNAFSQSMALLPMNYPIPGHWAESPAPGTLAYWAASASANGWGLAAGDVHYGVNNTNLINHSFTYFAPRSGIIPLFGRVDCPDYAGTTPTAIYNYGRNELKLTHMSWCWKGDTWASVLAMLNSSIPQEVAGGLDTRCPSMFDACKN